MLNIGQAIKHELERQERPVSWLAAKLGCDRKAVYRIFAKCSIDTHLLLRISTILHHNFFTPLHQAADQEAEKPM
ncbi:MAG: XRE family transcriptional regulator [Muribaculaceae bacterium]|nr:XRE family transcriptional regulator [Muribaculaceae bacterium]